MLVIDKPTGMVVNRADTTGGVETVQDWVESRRPDDSEDFDGQKSRRSENLKFGKSDTPGSLSILEEEFSARSGIVHRLDKDTSGLLVIAKTPEAFEKLKAQFKSRETVKKYLALVHGKVEPAEGSIDAPIERNPFNRKHFGVFPGGREAKTDYRTIQQFSNSALLEVTPHTGRTHQIRVHMKYVNHPIVADPIYGGRKNYRDDVKFCPRLFLHAAHLEITHPESGELLKFDSPLPPDLQTVLDRLQ